MCLVLVTFICVDFADWWCLFFFSAICSKPLTWCPWLLPYVLHIVSPWISACVQQRPPILFWLDVILRQGSEDSEVVAASKPPTSTNLEVLKWLRVGFAMASPQMSRVLMSLAFHRKRCGHDSEIDTATENSDNSGKMQPTSAPSVEKMPLPGFVKRELHKQGRCEPCVYNNKGTGCWYGDECRYCHFCTPEQVRKNQSRRFYMERALRKEKKFDQGQGAALCMDIYMHGMSRRESKSLCSLLTCIRIDRTDAIVVWLLHQRAWSSFLAHKCPRCKSGSIQPYLKWFTGSLWEDKTLKAIQYCGYEEEYDLWDRGQPTVFDSEIILQGINATE